MQTGFKLWLSFLFAFFSVPTFAGQPNVIVFLTDDQGWGDLSLHGNTNLSTPNIDSLARDGTQFENFYVCPVCSPTRSEFLTGRYHQRSGVYSTSAGGERIDLDELTIADTFKAAGYATAAFGKWHNGMQYPYHPVGRGFEYFYGFCSGHWGNYFSPMLERNGQITKGNGFVVDNFTQEAMKFIEQHQKRPFFVYLPYNTPHSPMQVPDRFWNKFKNHELPMRHRDGKENLLHTRAALAMCENIDWNVGRILDKLKQLELANDTIVLFFHDNGPNGARWNGDMKGRKGSTDEGGVRSPLLVRWTNKIPAGHKVNEVAGAIDLLPTLADLCEVEVSRTAPLDGVSLKQPIMGGKYVWPERMIFNAWRNQLSVRTQRYRLDNKGKLFDITVDPEQRHPIQDKQELVDKLVAAANKFREDLEIGNRSDDRPFVIGHPAFRFTQVPARDAVAHGNIKRSKPLSKLLVFQQLEIDRRQDHMDG